MDTCCPMCYVEYLSPIGEIDRDAYERARKRRIAQIRKNCAGPENAVERKRLVDRLKPLADVAVPCTCPCHLKRT